MFHIFTGSVTSTKNIPIDSFSVYQQPYHSNTNDKNFNNFQRNNILNKHHIIKTEPGSGEFWYTSPHRVWLSNTRWKQRCRVQQRFSTLPQYGSPCWLKLLRLYSTHWSIAIDLSLKLLSLLSVHILTSWWISVSNQFRPKSQHY